MINACRAQAGIIAAESADVITVLPQSVVRAHAVRGSPPVRSTDSFTLAYDRDQTTQLKVALDSGSAPRMLAALTSASSGFLAGCGLARLSDAQGLVAALAQLSLSSPHPDISRLSLHALCAALQQPSSIRVDVLRTPPVLDALRAGAAAKDGVCRADAMDALSALALTPCTAGVLVSAGVVELIVARLQAEMPAYANGKRRGLEEALSALCSLLRHEQLGAGAAALQSSAVPVLLAALTTAGGRRAMVERTLHCLARLTSDESGGREGIASEQGALLSLAAFLTVDDAAVVQAAAAAITGALIETLAVCEGKAGLASSGGCDALVHALSLQAAAAEGDGSAPVRQRQQGSLVVAGSGAAVLAARLSAATCLAMAAAHPAAREALQLAGVVRALEVLAVDARAAGSQGVVTVQRALKAVTTRID